MSDRESEAADDIVQYDRERGVYRTVHDFGGPGGLAETLTVALEEAARREDRRLSRPLYAIVDPDGLSQLFEPVRRAPRNDGAFAFPIDGFEVTVYADGVIEIRPSEGRGESE